MNKIPYKILMYALMILGSTIVARADYSYSNAVEALNPVAYWPLDETNQGPPAYIATNYGTLGAQATAYYGNDYYPNGSLYNLMTLFTGPVAGPTSDGAQAAQFNGGANSDDNSEYVIIPDDNHILDNGPIPFSAEVWVMPEGGDPNDTTGMSFASSEFAGLMKKGGGISFYTENGDPQGNTYGWTVSLAGLYAMGPPGGWYGGFNPGEWLNSTACWVVDFYNGARGNGPSLEFDVPMAEPTPQWFHLALTFDGTNANFYTNGVLAATTVLGMPQSTNTVIAPNQLGGITSATGAYQFNLNSSGAGYVPDTVNPFCVGNNNESFSIIDSGWPQTNNYTGFDCQNFNGALADVAVYTNALSSTTVLKHFTDASGSPTLYTNDVLSANPPIFLRFNEPAYTEPDPSTYAVANSYGNMSGAEGAYQPGVVPAVPGAFAGGLGPQSVAAQMNGFDAGVDVGQGILFGSELDPQNNPGIPSFSLAYWFKGNPADCYGRFQTIIGRGDSGWRSSMDNSGFLRWNPGNGPEIASPNNYNDGMWHHVVGVCDGTNATAYLYVDGQLVTSSTGVGDLAGSSEDLLIGGAPDYTTSDKNDSQQRYFAGEIAEVAFFTNALTADQVDTLYDAAELGPEITQPPLSALIALGSSGSLSVSALGNAPLSYQWYQGSTALTNVPGNILGATNSALTITNATLSNGGNYTVVVANSVGSVTSEVATVTIGQSPIIVQQPSPTNNAAYTGNSVALSVSAVGAAPLSYEWYNGASAISSTSNVLFAATLGTNTLDCVIQNSYGSITSSVVTVVGQAPPSSLTVNYSVVSPVYDGQGAFSDPGNTNWNLFAASGTRGNAAVNSAGASTLVSATLIYGFNNGAMGNTTNGYPCYLEAYEDAVNAGSPGIGTSAAPEGQLTINDLPQGKYELYLYSANYDGNRGSIFTVAPANGGTADGGTNGTVNGSILGLNAIADGVCTFAEGDNYVLFNDVVTDPTGAITVTYIPNPAGNMTGEAPFDGFQVIKIVPPVLTIKNQGGGNDLVSWAPAIGVLQSATNVAGPYSTIPAATSPYTNTPPGLPQQFFEVNVP